jgi:hypothetical protein
MKRTHIFTVLGVVIAVLIGVIVFGPDVVRSWQSPEVLAKFRSLLEGANRVVVAGPSVVDGRQKVYFVESDPKPVSELIDGISFARFGGGTVCACNGNAVIKFYRDDKLLLEVNSQHKQYIRWQGYFADTKLTGQSADFLVAWIKQRANDEQLKSIWPEDYRQHQRKAD